MRSFSLFALIALLPIITFSSPINKDVNIASQNKAIDDLAQVINPSLKVINFKQEAPAEIIKLLKSGAKLTQKQLLQTYQVREYKDFEKCKDADGNQVVGLTPQGKLCGTGILWTVGPDGGWVQGMEIDGKSAGVWRADQIPLDEKGNPTATKEMYAQALKKDQEIKEWAKTHVDTNATKNVDAKGRQQQHIQAAIASNKDVASTPTEIKGQDIKGVQDRLTKALATDAAPVVQLPKDIKGLDVKVNRFAQQDAERRAEAAKKLAAFKAKQGAK
jgi:hypothetical protein